MQSRTAVILSLETLFNKFQIDIHSSTRSLLEKAPEKISDKINQLAYEFNSRKLSVFEFYTQLVTLFNIDPKHKGNSYEEILKIPDIVKDENVILYLYSFDPYELTEYFPIEKNIFQKKYGSIDNRPYIEQIKKILAFIQEEKPAIQEIDLFVANQSPFADRSPRAYQSELVDYCQQNNIQGFFLFEENLNEIYQSFKEWDERERANIKADNFKQALRHLSYNMQDIKALNQILSWDFQASTKDNLIKSFIESEYNGCQMDIYHRRQKPDNQTLLKYINAFIHHIQFMLFLKNKGLLNFKSLRLEDLDIEDDGIEKIHAKLRQLKLEKMELEYILTEDKPTIIHLPAKKTPCFKYFQKKLTARQLPKTAFILSLDTLFNQFEINKYSDVYSLIEEKPEKVCDKINELAADFNSKKISVFEFYKQSASFLDVHLEWESNAYSNILKIPDIVNDECISLYLYTCPFQAIIKSDSYYFNQQSDLEMIKKIFAFLKEKEPTIKEINLFLVGQSVFTPSDEPELIQYCKENNIHVSFENPSSLNKEARKMVL